MKITIISRGDASSGGAGRMAEILATGLKLRGNDICHLIKKQPRPDYKENCKRIPAVKGDVLLRNAIGLDISGILLLAEPAVWRADIVHFHDFSVAFGLMATLIISRYKRVVFTLHDFSGLTGGCLNPLDCTHYLSGCGKCPQVGTSPLSLPFDMTKYHFRFLEKIARGKNANAITPSKYLFREAKKGAWRNGNVHLIQNVVETNIFTIESRDKGRNFLQLDKQHKAILFVSNEIMNPLKGFTDLEQTFVNLVGKHPELILVLVGKLEKLPQNLQPYKKQIRHLGSINNSNTMAEIFAACDCHVLPTRGDNYPCTILESLSTGTPVIAYQVGGIPEMYQSPEQGYTVDPNDSEGLIAAIEQFLNYQNGILPRQMIRKMVIESYGVESFIDKHLDIYKNYGIL